MKWIWFSKYICKMGSWQILTSKMCQNSARYHVLVQSRVQNSVFHIKYDQCVSWVYIIVFFLSVCSQLLNSVIALVYIKLKKSLSLGWFLQQFINLQTVLQTRSICKNKPIIYLNLWRDRLQLKSSFYRSVICRMFLYKNDLRCCHDIIVDGVINLTCQRIQYAILVT